MKVFVVHGWTMLGLRHTEYDPLVEALRAVGHDVDVPALPRTGWEVGDSWVNAEWLASKYPQPDALIGHSLGGFTVEYLARVHKIPRITLDSAVHNREGIAWPWPPPDMQERSAMRTVLSFLPASASRLLNIWSTHSEQNGYGVHIEDTHIGVLSNPLTHSLIREFLENLQGGAKQ